MIFWEKIDFYILYEELILLQFLKIYLEIK